MGGKIVIQIKIYITEIKKIITQIKVFFRLRWVKKICKSIVFLVACLTFSELLFSCYERFFPSYYNSFFPSSPNQIINNAYTTKVVQTDREKIICNNFFNNAALIKGIDQFINNENRYKLKDGIVYADLICNEKLPVNFCARVEFISRNKDIINFGLSEYSELNYNMFRIIVGDSGNTSIAIKDKDDKNVKIKYYSDSKYSDKLSLKDPIDLNYVVKLKITQQQIVSGQVELSIILDYTPVGNTPGRLVTASIRAIIENVNYSSDSKYLVGIGMYKSGAENNAVEIEFLNFQIKEFTI